MNKERLSNVELLRILSIFIIIVHHITLHSKFQFESGISLNKLAIQFLQMGGKIGVDIFILISGYFLVVSEKSVIRKTVRLWIEVLFYSLLFLIVTIIIGRKDLITAGNLEYSIFPVILRQYWFISVYIVMFILSPYINVLIHALSREKFRNLLILGSIMWLIVPTFTNKTFESNELIFFIYLYIGGAYIRLYKDNYNNKKRILAINLLSLIFTISTVTIFDIIEVKIPFVSSYETYFYGLQKLNIYILAITLFLFFKNLNIPINKFINKMAECIFGIYLIHENVFMRVYLWEDIFGFSKIQDKIWMPIYVIMGALIVMVLSCCIEYIRLHFIESIYMKHVDKIIEKFLSKVRTRA